MSYRFDDVDYEEDVIQEVVERGGESVVDPKNPYGANPKWFQPPGAGEEADEDDGDERVADDLKYLQDRISAYTDDAENIDWKAIKKTIQTLQKSLARFLKRSQKSRDIVGEIVATVQTLIGEWSNQESSKKNKTFEETRTLIEAVESAHESYDDESDAEDDEEAAASGPATSESESKEDPVKVLARRLTQALNSKKNSIRTDLMKVVKDAKTLQQPHIVACALAGATRAVLSKFSREKSLSLGAWEDAISTFTECKDTIQAGNLRVLETYAEYQPQQDSTNDEKANETFLINYTIAKTTIVIGGLQGLFEELFEAVRRMVNNTTVEKQYVQALEAECTIVDVGFDLMKNGKNAGRIPNLIFSVLSQRTPALHEILCKKFGLVTPFDINGLYKLCRSDATTMLQYAYHLALVGQYRQANVVLASDPASSRVLFYRDEWGERSLEVKSFAPTSVKVAFNRVIVQLALSHFKDGNVSEAADLLSSIREHTAKWGILFGQGYPFNNFQLHKDLRAKTTLLFNSIQTPPHYHIPHVSVELMYLVAISMKRAVQTSQGIISFDRTDSFANLRRNINEVAGSASTPNEYIIAFDDALQAGDVPKLLNALDNLPFWGILDGETSKAKIAKKAKAIALQCFIYSSAANFSTITSKYLQERFEMSESEVRKTINHLILSSPDHLTAYWEDNNEASIVVERCNVAGLRKTLGQAARNIGAIQAPAL